MRAVLFSNVSQVRLADVLAACDHMPHRVWSEPDPDNGGCFIVLVDKETGRDASGDARGASPRAQARAATRGPGSNPGRSTAFKSLSKLMGF